MGTRNQDQNQGDDNAKRPAEKPIQPNQDVQS